MNKFGKLGFVGLVALGLVGCASIGSVSNKMVDNKTDGVIYGHAGIDYGVSVVEVCKSINNKDPRCGDADSYNIVYVMSKNGYADGTVGINALLRKDSLFTRDLSNTMRTGDSKAVYAKAKVIAGQLGEVLEIASKNGDGKCGWSGMPRVGGTVCPAYDYDYRKDFIGVVFR
jgi:hypothetical protein